MEPVKQDFTGEPPPYAKQPEAFPCHNEPHQENPNHKDVPALQPQSTYPQGIPVSAFQEFPAGHLASVSNWQQTQQTTVVMTQPGRFAPLQVDDVLPPNFMSLSIFACLCCFWPLGLFAIVKSSQVDDAVRNGDLVAARDASRNARLLASISIAIGAASCLFLFIFYFGHRL